MQDIIDAGMLRRMFLAGAKNIEANKEKINSLNTFPGPAGNTGSNMTATVLSAVRNLSEVDKSAHMEEVTRAISAGVIKGARGNSGVILSQIIRGFIREIDGRQEIDRAILSDALERSRVTAHNAVIKPREGTMLAIAGNLAEKAAELKDEEMNMDLFLSSLVHCAEETVQAEKKTADEPEWMPEADAGSVGLLEFIRGAYSAFSHDEEEVDFSDITDNEPSKPRTLVSAASAKNKKPEPVKKEKTSEKYSYNTVFQIIPCRELTAREEKNLTKYLRSIGSDVECKEAQGKISISLNTNDPGLALQRGVSLGKIAGVSIEYRQFDQEEKNGIAEIHLPETEPEDNVMAQSDFDIPDEAKPSNIILSDHKENTQEKSGTSDGTESYDRFLTDDSVGSREGSPASDGTESYDRFLTNDSEELREGSPASDETDSYDGSQIYDAGKDHEETIAVPEVITREYAYVACCSGEGIKKVFYNILVNEVIDLSDSDKPDAEVFLEVAEKTCAENVFVLPNKEELITEAERAARDCKDRKIIVIPTKDIAQGIAAVMAFVPAVGTEQNTEIMKKAAEAVRTTELEAVWDDKEKINEVIETIVDDDSDSVTIYYGKDINEKDAFELAETIGDEYPELDVDVVYGGQTENACIISAS